jgi:hypothetical protein
VLNPRTDADFAAFATAAVDGGATTPELLQARLRERYPQAIVRERGISEERMSVWYTYRDGRWIGEGKPSTS